VTSLTYIKYDAIYKRDFGLFESNRDKTKNNLAQLGENSKSWRLTELLSIKPAIMSNENEALCSHVMLGRSIKIES
jgi:hypothetical protein